MNCRIPRSRAAEIHAANRDRLERERQDMARRMAKPLASSAPDRNPVKPGAASNFDQLLERFKEGKR